MNPSRHLTVRPERALARRRPDRPAGRHPASIALTLLAAAGVVLAGPTAAVASDGSAHDLRPFVECVRTDATGLRTVVLGYENTSRVTVTVPVGKQNSLFPKHQNGRLPTRFEPGLHRAVLAVDLRPAQDFRWLLGRSSASPDRKSPTCPPPTQMPVEGNGTGAAVALAAAGVLGAVVVRRARHGAVAAGVSDSTEGTPRA